MTSRLLNTIKFHAASQDQSLPTGRWGIVTGANGATVKVMLQPEGVPTDWLPLLSTVVGGGWGMVHIPPNGTQVFCMPDAGDHTNLVVVGATWNTGSLPPAAAQGEVWLVHSTGSAIKLTNDGKVSINDPAGSTVVLSNTGIINVKANANVTIDAPQVAVTNNLSVGTGATGIFAANGGVNVTVRDGIVTNIK